MNDDVRSREAIADPYAFYDRLREQDPVHWSDASHAWIISSHEEVCAAFADARLSSDRLTPLEARMSPDERAAMAETFQLLRGWMVFHDPPEHARLRNPLRHVFTPHAIRALEPKVEAIVSGLLDEMAEVDECELIDAFAFPLPAIVIGELLGVPVEDREQFKQWSLELSGLVFGAVEQPGRAAAASDGAAHFSAYFTDLIRRYEKAPADNLISLLIEARDSGESLSPDQMIGACTLLVFGGHESTTSLIANGVATLLQHPDQLDQLRHFPGHMPTAIEECMRYCGPANVMVRQVAEDHERLGRQLQAGQRVYLSIAGANRDPSVFEEPDRFDITRVMNPHVGFGHGIHFCLGAPLARMETGIALAGLLDRFPNMQLATDQLQWGGSIVGRRVATVPIKLT